MERESPLPLRWERWFLWPSPGGPLEESREPNRRSSPGQAAVERDAYPDYRRIHSCFRWPNCITENVTLRGIVASGKMLLSDRRKSLLEEQHDEGPVPPPYVPPSHAVWRTRAPASTHCRRALTGSGVGAVGRSAGARRRRHLGPGGARVRRRASAGTRTTRRAMPINTTSPRPVSSS